MVFKNRHILEMSNNPFATLFIANLESSGERLIKPFQIKTLDTLTHHACNRPLRY